MGSSNCVWIDHGRVFSLAYSVEKFRLLSTRHAICGTCGVMINGKPHGPLKGVTTCQLHMRSFKDGDELIVEPFRAKPFSIVRDLVINRKSFDNIEMHFGRGLYPYKIRNFRPIVKELMEVSIYFNPIIYYLFLIRKFITRIIMYQNRKK